MHKAPPGTYTLEWALPPKRRSLEGITEEERLGLVELYRKMMFGE